MAAKTQVPEVRDLARDAILKSMLENISGYNTKYPRVDIDVLKQAVLEKVVDAPNPQKPDVEFDPEIQLRGFLRAFASTPAYSAKVNVLDDKTKEQIRAFKDGDKWQETVKDGFRLPEINPAVSQTLGAATNSPNLPTQVKNCVLSSLAFIIKPISLLFIKLKMGLEVEILARAQATRYAGGPKVYEDEDTTNAKPIEVYSRLPFRNWGENINNTPLYTFIPTTILGVQNLVRYAKQNNLRVRCGGYRHSWSPTFSQDGEILISLLPIVQVTSLPDPISIRPTSQSNKPTELNRIELLDETPEVPQGKRWCRVGAAVTLEAFREWAVNLKQWTFPVDVILVETTIGGVNAPICHGAGAGKGTISDYVRRIECVDANGNLQSVSDPGQLRAAAGCFGLLGVVTNITYELDAMTYAIMKPLKVDVAQAIPPLAKEAIPHALRTPEYDSITQEQLKEWKEAFEKRAAEDYYAEWFWFTYQKKIWVNSWKNTTDGTNFLDYPNGADTFLQWLQGWIGGVMTDTSFFQALPGAWQAQLLATLGLAVLPPTVGEDATPTYKTLLPNALHFRRGVQNTRVRDMEYQIPIPNLPNSDKPDFTVVQRAWWDVINLVYQVADKEGSRGFINDFTHLFSQKHRDRRTPMRLTLELRIMGGSNVIMAPQAGNNLTASIEILTIPDADRDGEWQDFMQRVSDIWMAYKDNNNMLLNTRPHWAKDWDGITLGEGVSKRDAREYLRTVSYKDAIPSFKATLAEIGKEQGWGLGDIRARFSNDLWDNIVYS